MAALSYAVSMLYQYSSSGEKRISMSLYGIILYVGGPTLKHYENASKLTALKRKRRNIEQCWAGVREASEGIGDMACQVHWRNAYQSCAKHVAHTLLAFLYGGIGVIE